MKKTNKIGITLGLSLLALLGACGNGEQSETDTSTSADSIGEQVNYTITGIEPGAGITSMAEQTIGTYENLSGWELETSSTGAMLAQLGEAINNEEPIIVTGWSPHYMFAQHDLKYLEDPEETMGGPENIHTIARLGLEEEKPNAYQILDAFYLEIEEIEAVMNEALESSYEEAAANWVENNQDTVDSWLEGTEQMDGEEISLVTTQYDADRASNSILRIALEQQGYSVSITEVDPAVMFEAVANGEADASIAPWLPVTHGAFYEANEEDLVDLGPNAEGARNGFVVPSYMDIDSIEDLEPNQN